MHRIKCIRIALDQPVCVPDSGRASLDRSREGSMHTACPLKLCAWVCGAVPALRLRDVAARYCSCSDLRRGAHDSACRRLGLPARPAAG